MPRRVLLMISSMQGGGSERQTLGLLKHLDRAQFSPFLCLLNRSGSLLDQVPRDVAIHCFEPSIPAGRYFPGRILRDQIRWLAELLQRETIDVVYDRTFHMTMIAAPACESLQIPHVSTIVSPPEQALPNVESRFVTLKRWRLARAYRQANRIVAVSHAAAGSAVRYYGLDQESIEVIPNGIDIAAMKPAPIELAVTSDDRLRLVCVGRMTVEKGQVDLLEAVARVSESVGPIDLKFVGDGPLRNSLEQRAKLLSRRHRISFTGAVDEPIPFIANADALVLPSRFEGMPNVVLEAMALGIPVIATRAGGTIELERDQPTVLWAEANDPSSLTDAIETFASDRISAAQRATSARKLVQDHHDIRQTTRRIESLLG